jgi:membrane-bound inhibitor of C-type lysozyme
MRPNHPLSAITLALLVAGCNTLWAGNPTRTKDIGVGIRPGPPITGEIDRVTYDCADGTSFMATFDDEKGNARIEPNAGTVYVLHIEPSGSGFYYRDGTHELRGKGDEAMWTADAKSVACKARPEG